MVKGNEYVERYTEEFITRQSIMYYFLRVARKFLIYSVSTVRKDRRYIDGQFTSRK